MTTSDELTDLHHSRFIQIDDPMVAMLCDQPYLDVQKKEGLDLKALLDPAIIAHNAIIKDLPSDLTLACHLCRGNLPKGDTAAIGGFEPLAERLFNETNYTRFALEFDDPEITGSFAPLQFLPKGKLVVLGLITTKDSELEKVEDMKAKIYEAADIIAKAQGRSREDIVKDSLAVSPGCGFASLAVITGTGMTEDIEFQKLGIVKKVAEETFGST